MPVDVGIGTVHRSTLVATLFDKPALAPVLIRWR